MKLIIKLILAVILIVILANSRLLIPAIVGVAAFAFLRSRHKKEMAAHPAETEPSSEAEEDLAAAVEPVAPAVVKEAVANETAEAKPVRRSRAPVAISNSSGYKYENVGIYRPQNADLGDMPELGDQIYFQQDPENPYDSFAVKAIGYDILGEQCTLGYLNRGKLKDMVWDWLENDWEYKAYVTRADSRLEIELTLNRE